MFPDIVGKDNPMGNAPKANTLGVSTTLVVELPSQTPNLSEKALRKKSRVESPKKELDIAMLVKVLLQDKVDNKKHQQEDKEEWKHWMNKVVPNMMVGISRNTTINIAAKNAATLMMIMPSPSKSQQLLLTS